MDLTFKTSSGYFNYRVCGLVTDRGRLLVMKDKRSPYYYLPGGRVKLGETAEAAVVRELEEELGKGFRIDRPLWLNQGFFEEDVTGEQFHEICLYFLMDHTDAALNTQCEAFEGREAWNSQVFTWMPFEKMRESYLYPVFLKEAIFHLPEQLTLRSEWE